MIIILIQIIILKTINNNKIGINDILKAKFHNNIDVYAVRIK